MKNKNSGFIFHSRYLNISYFSGEILIWGDVPFTRYKKYEIQANTSFGSWNLYSNSNTIFKRFDQHEVYILNILLDHYGVIFKYMMLENGTTTPINLCCGRNTKNYPNTEKESQNLNTEKLKKNGTFYQSI